MYAINWSLCIILVKDTVQVPSTHAGAISYINSAVNGSSYHGGAAGNEANCLGVIGGIKSCSYAGSNCMTFDGPVTFTAKNTGTVGGAIIGYFYSGSSVDPSTIYPLLPATTLANANTYVGSTEKSIYNYMLITDSVGITSASNIILDSVELVSGAEVTFYGASLKFSSVE